MVIGAMPMPAETSDTARLRCVSNQPVTQAIIGAKIAAVAPPTIRPKTSWNSMSDVAWLGERKARGQDHRPGDHDQPRAVAVGQAAPDHAREGQRQEADGHGGGDAGHRPAGILGDGPQQHRQRKHRADRDAAQKAAGGDDHPAIRTFLDGGVRHDISRTK